MRDVMCCNCGEAEYVRMGKSEIYECPECGDTVVMKGRNIFTLFHKYDDVYGIDYEEDDDDSF